MKSPLFACCVLLTLRAGPLPSASAGTCSGDAGLTSEWALANIQAHFVPVDTAFYELPSEQ